MQHPSQQDPIIDFDDYEDDPDDNDAVAAYARELQEAVDAFGATVIEPGQRNEEL